MAKRFVHDPQLARAAFEAARENGFNVSHYRYFLKNYVKPMLRLLMEAGEIDEIEGLKMEG